MVANKKRLYVALYPSGVIHMEERKYECLFFDFPFFNKGSSPYRYHWAFVVGPKVEDQPQVPGIRYHVKKSAKQGWIYEEVSLANEQSTARLLARIVIAKVEHGNRLVEIFRSTPVVQNDPNWRCRTWVADVLSKVASNGKAVGTAELSWIEVEAAAREYVAKKTADGSYAAGKDMTLPKPTWSMLEKKETIP